MVKAESTSPNRPEVIAFLNAIKEKPEDDDLRLILADWLEERDDPRGTFLRVETELASMSRFGDRYWKLRKQRNALWKRWSSHWLTPLRPFARSMEPLALRSTRGLLVLPLDASVLQRAELLDLAESESWAWVEEIHTRPGKRQIEKLNDSPLLSRIPSLDLSECRLDLDGAQRLAQCDFLTNLRRLNLNNSMITQAGLLALLETGKLTNLTTWNLGRNDLYAKGMQYLAEANLQLRELNLDSNHLSGEGGNELSKAPWLSELEALSLSGSFATSRSRKALFQCSALAGLRKLRVARCRLRREGMRELTGSGFVESLTSLDLSHNSIDADALWSLASVEWSSLRKLKLSRNHLTREFLEALMDARNLYEQLQSLSLDGQEFDSESLLQLGRSSYLRRIRSLTLDLDNVRADAFDRFIRSPNLRALEELCIDTMTYRIPPEIVQSVCSADLKTLRRLEIMPALENDSARLLLEAQSLEQLQEIVINTYALSEETRALLAERFDVNM